MGFYSAVKPTKNVNLNIIACLHSFTEVFEENLFVFVLLIIDLVALVAW